MRYFVALIVSLTLFLNVALYSLGTTDVILSLAAILFSGFYAKTFQFSTHIGRLIVLLYVYMPTVFIPAFHFGLPALSEIDYVRLASLGAKVYTFTIFVILTIGWIWKTNKKHSLKGEIHIRPISDQIVNCFFVIMFGLTLFSLSIGLGVMGRENAVLPYGIGGIITMARMHFAPLFFLLVVESWILSDRKIKHRYLWLFLGWTLLETFTRLSKGVLISNILPIILLMLLAYKPSLRKVAFYAAPLLVIFLSLYPIIQTMRQFGNEDISASFSLASKEVNESGDNDHTLRVSFNRAFMTAVLYQSDYSYINQNEVFDFSNAPQIIAWHGSARYQTVVIDGYPPTAHHSSGTSGILDPMLLGGYGLCFVVLLLIVSMACYADARLSHMLGVYVILCLIVSDLISRQNISYIFDGLFLPYFSIRILMLFLIAKLNYGYRFIKHKRMTLTRN